MKELKFIQSMSIAEFKTTLGIDKVEVVKNPKTEKLFITDGVKTIGAASKDYADNPRVSLVQLGEAKFYLLHKGAANNVLAVF